MWGINQAEWWIVTVTVTNNPNVARELAPARLRRSRQSAHEVSLKQPGRLDLGPLRAPAGASFLATGASQDNPAVTSNSSSASKSGTLAT